MPPDNASSAARATTPTNTLRPGGSERTLCKGSSLSTFACPTASQRPYSPDVLETSVIVEDREKKHNASRSLVTTREFARRTSGVARAANRASAGCARPPEAFGDRPSRMVDRAFSVGADAPTRRRAASPGDPDARRSRRTVIPRGPAQLEGRHAATEVRADPAGSAESGERRKASTAPGGGRRRWACREPELRETVRKGYGRRSDRGFIGDPQG